MSDWELVENQKASDGDWELLNSEEVKSPKKDESVSSWLPKDILVGLMGLGKNLGEYGLAGVKGVESLGKIGQKAMNQLPGPHPSMQSPEVPYSEQGKQLLNRVIPEDYAERYGPQDQGLLDAMIQGGITHAPEIYGGARLVGAGIRALPHFTQRGAARRLNLARGQFEQRLPPVHQDQELANLMDRASPYLDRTQATQRMLQDARGGGYEPLFSTASQLGHESRSLQRSPLASERRIFREPQEARQDILSRLERHARFHGEDEAADLLRNGINDYRRYVRFRDNVVPVLKKIGVPTSVVAALTVGYKGAKKLIND